MDIYREFLLDHYHHPHGWGLKPTADYAARYVNPLCGDDISVQLVVAGETIVEMRFEGHGCVISRAAGSVLADAIRHHLMSEVVGWDLRFIERLLGVTLPPNRHACGLLALRAAQRALVQ